MAPSFAYEATDIPVGVSAREYRRILEHARTCDQVDRYLAAGRVRKAERLIERTRPLAVQVSAIYTRMSAGR